MGQAGFQSLCDAYLAKKGYDKPHSLGIYSEADKTTKGTPDTYFKTEDGKYVLVEYTTQSTSLFNKAKSDISKCLDIDVRTADIAEIIYCHTSSNFTPEQDQELHKLCEPNIILTLFGLDEIANDILLKYPILANDFLDLHLSTEQILALDDFIRKYNKNEMAAPLDTEFLGRENVIKSIGESLKVHNAVLLVGAAGTGKTRIAVEYLKNYSTNYEELVVRNTGISLREELITHLEIGKEYLILIDDANQISELPHIIRHIKENSDKYNIKVIITVRDYAKAKVEHDIGDSISYSKVEVNSFKDEDIKKLCEQNLGISNHEYLKKIANLAKGNARIAILAGKIACEKNTLESIADVSDLYEQYYYPVLEKINNQQLCTSAGILAFLDALHLDKLDDMQPIFDSINITIDDLTSNIKVLHELELVDICHDKVVRFSEQCFGNYICKYIFIDKKWVSLSQMIITTFEKRRQRMIQALNTLGSIFKNEKVLDFVVDEVSVAWEHFEKDEDSFANFVRVFFQVKPTEALLLIKNEIDVMLATEITINDIEIEDKQNGHVENKIIEILGGFHDKSQLPEALDLFFRYYLKKPELYSQFRSAIGHYFSINIYSERMGYYTEAMLLNKFQEYGDNWSNELVVVLFLDIAKNMIKINHDYSESEGISFVIHSFNLRNSESLQKYRKDLWDSLLQISQMPQHREKVAEIIKSYRFGYRNEIDKELIEFDFENMKKFFVNVFSPNIIDDCIMAKEVCSFFEREGMGVSELSDYFENEAYKIYDLLLGKKRYELELDEEISLEECERLNKEAMYAYLDTWDFDALKKIVDTYILIRLKDHNNNAYSLGTGMEHVFNRVFERNPSEFVDLFYYYISQNPQLTQHIYTCVQKLLDIMNVKDVFALLNKCDYEHKNSWLYAYYNLLPEEHIGNDELQGLYSFLNEKEGNIISTPLRDVLFLEKYSKLDKDVFIKGCKIIFAKKDYSPFWFNIYFDLLFNEHSISPQTLIEKFEENYDLLSQIYIVACANSHADWSGIFLREIYEVYPQILDDYLQNMLDAKKHYNRDDRIRALYELDNFIVVMDKIMNTLNGDDIWSYSYLDIFETMMCPPQGKEHLVKKQDAWIKHYISENAQNTKLMDCLFDIIANMGNDRKIEYIKEFLKLNQKFEAFKKLPLTPRLRSWSGSEITILEPDKKYLQLLCVEMNGIELLEHKRWVEENIDWIENRIRQVEMEEMLRGGLPF